MVHIHGMWAPWMHWAFQWAERRGRPVVFSPHGALSPWAMHHKWWKKCLPWWLWFRGHIMRAACIHATANQEAESIRQLGFKNAIAVVPLGTDLPNQMATYDKDVKILLFVGRIYPVKGLDLLLKAWARSQARTLGWHLVCVGPDQAGHMMVLEELAQCLGLSVQQASIQKSECADVTFTGALYGREKDEAYLSARGLILPSYTENFGSVVVDALAFGLPVLASTGTPWAELRRAGCGECFDLREEDEVRVLHKFFNLKDAERQFMGRQGRRWVSVHFIWAELARQMYSYYTKA